jgi:hypothetical protein
MNKQNQNFKERKFLIQEGKLFCKVPDQINTQKIKLNQYY